MRFPRLIALLLFALVPAGLDAREFTVVAYNVDNLFDVDGVAGYDDYQPAVYTPAHLRTKLENLTAVLARFNDGRGPDLILFQEIELDLTPRSRVSDEAAFLRRYSQTTFDRMLGQSPLPPELRGLPAEAWLLKAMHDRGLTGYSIAASNEPPARHEDGNRRSIKNVVFTRFPITATRSHAVLNARHILEVELSIEGHRFHVFNNHWKSGASDAATEDIRIQNARVLRRRIDAILQADAHADILVGGDLNSQHDQRLRYPRMRTTGINDVLRAGGDERAVQRFDGGLYNLWHELPPAERGSDVFRGEWGTLMHLIVSSGLYDRRGVQYVDDSFGVARFARLNADASGLPLRWNGEMGSGHGYSDHFPVHARFTTVAEVQSGWMDLKSPAGRAGTNATINRVEHRQSDLAGSALTLAELPRGADLRDGRYSGRLFRVEGQAGQGQYLSVRFAGDEYEVFSPDPAIRDLLYAQRRTEGRLSFYGELGTFRGRWQFLVRDASWVQ